LAIVAVDFAIVVVDLTMVVDLATNTEQWAAAAAVEATRFEQWAAAAVEATRFEQRAAVAVGAMNFEQWTAAAVEARVNLKMTARQLVVALVVVVVALVVVALVVVALVVVALVVVVLVAALAQENQIRSVSDMDNIQRPSQVSQTGREGQVAPGALAVQAVQAVRVVLANQTARRTEGCQVFLAVLEVHAFLLVLSCHVGLSFLHPADQVFLAGPSCPADQVDL